MFEIYIQWNLYFSNCKPFSTVQKFESKELILYCTCLSVCLPTLYICLSAYTAHPFSLSDYLYYILRSVCLSVYPTEETILKTKKYFSVLLKFRFFQLIMYWHCILCTTVTCLDCNVTSIWTVESLMNIHECYKYVNSWVNDYSWTLQVCEQLRVLMNINER